MAGDEEDYGSGRITIELDEGRAVQEAATLGAQIERALTRATRNLGSGIRDRIQRALRSGITVPVHADTRRFDAEVRGALRRVGDLSVAVTADVSQLRRGLFRSRTGAVPVPVEPDTRGFGRALQRALRSVQAEIQVRADSRRLVREIEQELRRIRPAAITVPVEADIAGIQARLRALDAPTITATVTLDIDEVRQQLQQLANQQINIPIVVGGRGGAGAAGATAGSSVLSGLTGALMAAGPWGAVVAAAAAYAAMIGKALMTGIEGIIESQRITGTLKAQLGLGAQEAGSVGRVVGQLYAHGIVESVEDGTAAVQAAIKAGLAAPDDLPGLESLATKITDVGRLMEEDVGKVARAVGQMVKTGLVDNATQGLDLLTRGMQNGANVAEDLLDTFTEYPVQFRQLGLSGEEALGLIQQGLRAGARDSDVIADAFKEFSIEAAQGGTRVVDAFKEMGLNADELTSAFAKGGPAARDALDEVLTKLKTIEDPLKRNQIEVGLFGTKAEDLASSLKALDLDTAAAEMDGFGGAAKRAGDDLRNNLGDKLQTIFRETKQAFQALFTGDFTQIADVGKAVQDALPMLKETGQKAVTAIIEGVTEYGPKIFQKLYDLAFDIGERVDIWGPLLLKLAAGVSALPAVLWSLFFTALGGLLAGIGTRLVPYLEQGWEAVTDFFTETIPAWAAGLGRDVLDGLASGFQGVVGFFASIPGRVVSGLGSVGSTVGQVFTDAFEWAKSAVSSGIDAVVEFFAALPGRLAAGLMALGPLLLDLVTSAIAYTVIGILTAIAGIVWVFTELPGKIADGLAWLGTALVSAFTTGLAVLQSWLVTAFEATVAWFRALPGRIAAALSALGGLLVIAFSAAWSSVTGWVVGALNAMVAFFRGLPGRIVAALGALRAQLVAVVASATTSAMVRVTQFGAAVTTFFRSIPSRVRSALSTLGTVVASAFTNARTRAQQVVNSMITSISGLFRGLGGRITAALGDIGGQIVRKIKSGLPASVRSLLPFANGGIVDSPTAALIGEAGTEVVIPLTRPRRAVELAEQSGLVDLLIRRGVLAAPAPTRPAAGGASGGGGQTVTHNWNITTNSQDPRVLSEHLYGRMAYAAGV
ncbi:phage tail tape measure protein [Streptomyces bacillaris]|uniref:phage tail tape measure protein n=1 Tax=Streptomyces bacillaris TaxID=68179 RepID=UPI00362F44BB